MTVTYVLNKGRKMRTMKEHKVFAQNVRLWCGVSQCLCFGIVGLKQNGTVLLDLLAVSQPQLDDYLSHLASNHP